MNKRMLGELYKQAHVPHTAIDPSNNMPYETTCFSANKFAELIVQEMVDECAKVCVQHAGWTPDMIANQVKQHFGVEE